MPKCSRKDCGNEANQTVRLKLANDKGEMAEVYATIHACSEEHQAPQVDIAQFFALNWPRIEMIFEAKQLDKPVLEKTEYAWVPTDEYEAFVRLQIQEGRQVFQNRVQ
jgi:hypothetical protein